MFGIPFKALFTLGLTPMRTLLVNRIAFEYDFNEKFDCYKIENGKAVKLSATERVLFLGSTQKLGIAAHAEVISGAWPIEISTKEVEKFSPKGFTPVVCNDPKGKDLLENTKTKIND